MARIFLAIPLTEEIKNKVLEVQRRNTEVPHLKWMRPENLHMTIYFIGHVPRKKTKEIIDEIKPVLESKNKFTLEFSGFEILTDDKGSAGVTPRIIWARFYQNDIFSKLHFDVHAAVKRRLMTIPDINPWGPHPHITLARYNTSLNTSEIVFPKTDLKQMEIKDCELWESVPTPRGVNYECVEKFSFR